MTSHHVRMFWSGRADSVDRLGYHTYLLLTAFAGVQPLLAGFRRADRKGRTSAAPLDSQMACTEALEEARVVWRSGSEERTSYTPSFILRRDGALVARLSLTLGIEPLDLGPIFAPNKVDLEVRGLDPRTGRALLEDALRAAVAVFRPDWGHAGAAAHPPAPIALFSDGAPTVGWMTYLSRAYPRLPATLPSPAVASAVADFGTVVVAHPKLFDPADPAHVAAVDATARALRDARVLVPAHALRAAR
jgi:hypothetical protein